MSAAGQCRPAADTLVSICVRADCYVRCDGDETQKSKKPALKAGFSNVAPLTGLEPVTYGLTVRRSTD